MISQTTGLYYPTRDSCKQKGDPKEGCLTTEAMYYDEDILWMQRDNYFTIEDPSGSVIKSEKNLNGALNYKRSAKSLGCGSHMY